MTPGEADTNFEQKVVQKTTTYAILVSDNRNTIEGNHASTPFTITLGDAATMIAAEIGDFQVTIANVGAAAVTVARAGSDTIDGAATSIVLQDNQSVTLKVSSAGNNYQTIGSHGGPAVGTTATFSGSFTSIGIDDNATGERVQISDTLLMVGTTSASYTIAKPDSTNFLAIYGGTTANGGALVLSGNGDFSIRSGSDTWVFLDASAGAASFRTGIGATTEWLSANNSQNATFANDVTSTAGTFKPLGDTATSDAAAVGYTATEGLILTGQGSTNDLTIKNDADVDVITIPTGTTGVTFAGTLTIDSIVQPKVKIIDIGDWNMDATAAITVAHGLTLANIRTAEAMIRNDADTNYFPFTGAASFSTEIQGAVTLVDATNVSLQRLAAGNYDNANFDATSYNRGWITIQYV